MRNCETCMRANPEQTRQLLACPYAPAPPEHLLPWVKAPAPPGFRPLRADDGTPFPRDCPGYTTSLPEVIEIARARVHWDKGHLVEFCRGEPTEPIMVGIEIINGAFAELMNWKSTPASQGGGAEG